MLHTDVLVAVTLAVMIVLEVRSHYMPFAARGYLVWNLFLAWIPYVCARVIWIVGRGSLPLPLLLPPLAGLARVPAERAVPGDRHRALPLARERHGARPGDRALRSRRPRRPPARRGGGPAGPPPRRGALRRARSARVPARDRARGRARRLPRPRAALEQLVAPVQPGAARAVDLGACSAIPSRTRAPSAGSRSSRWRSSWCTAC